MNDSKELKKWSVETALQFQGKNYEAPIESTIVLASHLFEWVSKGVDEEDKALRRWCAEKISQNYTHPTGVADFTAKIVEPIFNYITGFNSETT